ncbi:MAG: LON peptidase substrate-binding domain-containing protein [Planctomycetota bacterium]
MEPIPSAWPPEPLGERAVVPLFPLPRLWLFPHVVLPLHIFERRYVQMIEDCLDGPGRIVIGTVPPGYDEQLAGSPPVQPIAGLGEIGRHEKLPDGRYDIWLYGQTRAHIREVDSDRLYRKVEVEPIDESEPDGPETEALREEVTEAIRARVEKVKDVPAQVPLSALADFLTLRMPLPPEVTQGLYSQLDPVARAKAALLEHNQRPITGSDSGSDE